MMDGIVIGLEKVGLFCSGRKTQSEKSQQTLSGHVDESASKPSRLVLGETL